MTAAEALRAGGAVILPTDTVYGLCALPGNEDVLYELKQRDRSKPIALVALDVESLLAFAPGLDRRILMSLLPGPYTLVLPLPAGGTIGVRVPNLPSVAVDVLAVTGPVAATSANLAGGPDPRTVDEIPRAIRDRVAAIVDGGELRGTPSTVLDFTGAEPRIVREGAVPGNEAIARVRDALAS
ncbi:MAG TPA: L-threonylcarbamoyladenylate synthase [Gaiellaceae bacterium]|nr:L-threonylcarbamoyladenylate synthase [Gaiellaceae bacterium]